MRATSSSRTEQEAKDIIAQLDKGADFATLAKDKTTDPSGKSNGGDLGYFTKQDMVPEFANAAFALKPGEYTKTPVKTQFGWHVIKLEDRRQGKAGTYEQVAPEIAQQMTQQVVATKLQELRGQGKIELYGPDGKMIASNAAPPQPAQQQAAPQHNNNRSPRRWRCRVPVVRRAAAADAVACDRAGQTRQITAGIRRRAGALPWPITSRLSRRNIFPICRRSRACA